MSAGDHAEPECEIRSGARHACVLGYYHCHDFGRVNDIMGNHSLMKVRQICP